ncbi:hypothetical protein BJY01DRAFT_246935 [Aspergillus pseudoustus]|uniref:Uncharacterized protein n=1 Tax=Aspergillus pseudoustus TaxID=1810923 RepID=A0ABR4K4B2_9EURO
MASAVKTDGDTDEVALYFAPPSPNRFLFIDAFDLKTGFLATTLNIHHQPALVDKLNDQSFFEPAFRIGYDAGLFTNAAVHWTRDTMDAMESAYHQEIADAEVYAAIAFRRGSALVNFIRPQWLMNPAVLSKPYAPQGFDVVAWAWAVGDGVPRIYYLNDGFPFFSASNRTVLPDDYLGNYRMVFSIQHPIMVFPSIYRKLNKDNMLPAEMAKPVCELYMTFRWMRMLYDVCDSSTSIKTPLVIAHDLIYDLLLLRPIVALICRELGLDESVVLFEELEDEIAAAQPADLRRRASVLRISYEQQLSADEAEVAACMPDWISELGEPAAYMLAALVRDAIPDYDYLRDKAVTA